MIQPRSVMSRRAFLAGAGTVVTAFALPRASHAGSTVSDDGYRVLRARPGTAAIRGSARPATPIWGYDGAVPGPTLRVKRGEELKVRLVNDLPQPTVIHWHGLRLPNAMDGVPHLTQAPVAVGESFDYRFPVKDAGTFWYHSHLYSSEQLERGLYGVLIVDEPEPPQVDHDMVLVFDDWRLTANGDFDPRQFRSLHDAAHAGRIGGHLTVNSTPGLDIPVKANERLRLRLVNTANARVMPIRIERHRVDVIAVDGQPAEPFIAGNGRMVLGPGNRVDVIVDATLSPGDSAPIVIEDFRQEVPIAHLRYAKGEPARPAPLSPPQSLPANPLPEQMDFAGAIKLDVPLDGGAMRMMMGGMGRGMMGMGPMGGGEVPGHGLDPRARVWTLAGFASSGHDGPPLFTAKRGQTVMLAFINQTAFPHAMHIHGHHFRQLDRLDDGWKPYWLDTVMVDVREISRIAFVADNPGKWMMHCHMIEHQETGMAAWFEVT